MKKKRIISFALALVMVVGLLSVVAVAYSCPYCGSNNTRETKKGTTELMYTTRVDGGCPNTTVSHLHYTYRTPYTYKCNSTTPSVCLREFIIYRYDYDVCRY